MPNFPAHDPATGRIVHDRTHGRYRPHQLRLSDYGIKFDGTTDNTAALDYALTEAAKLAAGTQRRVHLYGDESRVMRANMPKAVPGIAIRETMWLPPTGGFTRHGGTGGIYGPDSAAAHRFTLIDCHIDGEKDQHPTTANIDLDGNEPTITVEASTGGTLDASKEWGYRIAFRSAFGETMPSPAGHYWGGQTGTTMKLRVTWTIPTGGAGNAKIVVYGRAPWDWGQQVELAELAPGTTSWVDDGTATGTKPWRWVDTYSPSWFLTGGNTRMVDTTIRNLDGSFATQYLGDVPVAPDGTRDPWPAPMESILDRVTIAGCRGGAYHAGPHDSLVSKSLFLGNGDVTIRNNMASVGPGPVRWDHCHFYGDARYALYNLAPGEITTCQIEGGTTGQLMWGCSETTMTGGDIFHGRYRHADGTADPYEATVRGLVFGDDKFNIAAASAAVYGTKFRMYGANTGVAIDLTRAAGAAVIIDGYIEQPADGLGKILAKASGTQHHHVRLANQNTGQVLTYDGGAATIAI